MKIGFIGAGRCGMSLARYFERAGLEIAGFCSRHGAKGYENLSARELIAKSNVIFITVKDGEISRVWESIKETAAGKIVCHCSGSLSSSVFSEADSDAVCSVHPLLAFSSEKTDISAIKAAFFTLEGGNTALGAVKDILSVCGNRYVVIDKTEKTRYHAAACFASNFVVAVCEKAEQLLEECGFARAEAHAALVPLMKNNMDNIIEKGTNAAITGPAARGDTETIAGHLAVMGRDVGLYRALTDIITDMTGRKFL